MSTPPRPARKPRGLWAVADVPHRGWIHDHIEDLEEPDHLCEMCLTETVRYVHHVHHADHPALAVGCVCAGNMTGDYAAVKARESAFKNRQTRRRRGFKAWADPAGWSTNANGNHWRRDKHHGHSATVYRQRGVTGLWKAVVNINGAPSWLPSAFDAPGLAMVAVAAVLFGPAPRVD